MNIKNEINVEPLLESGSILLDSKAKKNAILEYLREFPLNAKSWKDATQELSDIARWIEEEVTEKITYDSKSKTATPSEHNKYFRGYIAKNIAKLSPQNIDRLYQHFSHWFNQNLHESETDENYATKVQRFMDDKSRHFMFGDFVMERLDSNVIGETSISLLFHKNNTVNVTDFVKSVKTRLENVGIEMSINEEERLINHYMKYGTR